ncbi:MAG: S49 family peptidase, partial [Planctomycetota bacterium]
VTLSEVIAAIDKAADSKKMAAIVIRLKDASFNATQTEELGAAFARARKAGVKIHVFSESYENGELRLGAAADESLIQPGGPVSLTGVHMEEIFLADTLAWVGVKADMVQIGDYKGAKEQMANSKPSPQWDQNINGLLDSQYANFRRAFTAGKGFSESKLDEVMSQAWMTDSARAVGMGLISAEMDWAELNTHLEKAYGGEVLLDDSLVGGGGTKLDMSNPFALMTKLSQTPDVKLKKPTIAVLHIDGVIVDGDSKAGGFMGGGESVGSRTIRRMVEELIEEPLVKGVVLRINSPGGSATASEVMWQGFQKLAKHKPVWVSVGSMAASGGYYCLVGGSKVYVNPSSIVGSIGVVGGRMAMGELYSKLHVNVVSRSRGPMSDLFRSTGAWTPAELAIVEAKMKETYQQFTSRVTAGRPGIDLAKTAEGRLFTGDKAVGLKMADKIGGLRDAVGDLAMDLKLSDFGIQHYPGPKSLPEVIEDSLGGLIQSPSVSAQGMLSATGAEIFGEAWPQMQQAYTGAMQLRTEPVILMSPSVLIMKK